MTHIYKKIDDLARIKLTFNNYLRDKFMSLELVERLGSLKLKALFIIKFMAKKVMCEE